MSRAVRRVVAPAAVAAALLVVWEVWARVADLPAFVLPAPSQVWRAGVEQAPLLGPHVATTLLEAALGLALGALVGLVLAVAIAAWPALRDTVYPLVTVTQTVPVVVLAPLLVLWAGFGLAPKVILVALTAFFPVLVATVSAMAAADDEHVDVVLGLGGSRVDQFRLVRLPAALPGALGGLRVAATYAIGAAVVSEYLAGYSGLGVFIQRARKGYEVDSILVAVVLVAVLTGLLFLLVDALARLATPWQRGRSATS